MVTYFTFNKHPEPSFSSISLVTCLLILLVNNARSSNNMYLRVCLCILLTPAFAEDDADAVLTNYKFTKEENGAHSLQMKTSNGIERNETSRIVLRDGKKYRTVEGVYKYVAPDDKLNEVTYRADDRGFYYTSRIIVRVPPRISSAALASLNAG